MNPNLWRQFETGIELSETSGVPAADHCEAALFAATRTHLNDGNPSTLNDSCGPLGPADVTWAWQWDITLNPNQSFIISKDKNLRPPIPEPSTMLLLGVGLMGLAYVGRRHLKRQEKA